MAQVATLNYIWLKGTGKENSMKITYRNGIPTKASLERIIDNRLGFWISDIYSAKYPQIIISGERGNANAEQVISDFKKNGIEVVKFEPSNGMRNGKIEIKPK